MKKSALLFALLLFPLPARCEPVPDHEGWTYFNTNLTSNVTLDPGRMTVFYRLVPPEPEEPFIIGEDLMQGLIRGELTEKEILDAAKKMKGKGADFTKKKTELETLFVPPATKQAAPAPQQVETAAEKAENLWNLALPVPKPQPLPVDAVSPPPPAPTMTALGASLVYAHEIKKDLPKPACVRLKVGEEKLIEADFKTLSPTTVEARYRLRRENDKLWKAELNLKYVPSSSFDLPMKKEEVDPFFRRRVNQCLATYSPAFRNPNGDQMLQVVLTKDPTVPEVEIKIGGARRRSSMHHYESDADCAVILHEMFHLFGLVDEYDDEGDVPRAVIETEYQNSATKEKVKKEITFKAPSDCRAISPQISLMHWHDEAAKNSLDPKVRVERCFCDKTVSCLLLAKTNDGKACPKGTKSFVKMEDVKPGAEFKTAPNDTESFVLKTDFAETVGKGNPGRASLLYPAHFRAVTEPGCEDVNWKYYACARNAYRFTKRFPGEWATYGVKKVDYQGCLPAPADCMHGYDWLK